MTGQNERWQSDWAEWGGELSRRTRKETGPPHLPLAGSTTLARWWARVSNLSPVYGRPSARQEASCRSDRPRWSRVHSTRESRIVRDATRSVLDRVRAGERGSQNMPGISHRWIRITGKRSRFVTTFRILEVGYFDICLGRDSEDGSAWRRDALRNSCDNFNQTAWRSIARYCRPIEAAGVRLWY